MEKYLPTIASLLTSSCCQSRSTTGEGNKLGAYIYNIFHQHLPPAIEVSSLVSISLSPEKADAPSRDWPFELDYLYCRARGVNTLYSRYSIIGTLKNNFKMDNGQLAFLSER